MKKEKKELVESSKSGLHTESWWAVLEEHDPAYKVGK